MLRASVIIPHYNQPDALRRCLDSLIGQDMPASGFEIIVVDNHSPGGVDGLAALYPSVRFLDEPMRGAACARNRGMAAARGPVFAFIDADCIAQADWLRRGVEGLEGADLSGGDICVTISNPGAPTPVEAFEQVFAFRQRLYINRKHFSVTANLFARREVAEAIGPFVNGVAEDAHWCQRARMLGFRLAFNDTSIISHPARASWGELTDKWDRLVRERWNGADTQGFAARMAWAGTAVATAFSVVPHLAMVMVSRRVTGSKDRLAAAHVLARIRLWRAGRMMSLLRASPGPAGPGWTV